MTSHEGPEEGEQRGGNTVTAAGKPYTRDVHHDTEPAPPRASGYFAGLTQALTRTDAYRDGHLSRPAFLSLAILTFITFVGNFTQLQLSAALPTLVSDFHISVTLGQWMTSIFQLTMGVMVPLTAYLTRPFLHTADRHHLNGRVHARLGAGVAQPVVPVGALRPLP